MTQFLLSSEPEQTTPVDPTSMLTIQGLLGGAFPPPPLTLVSLLRHVWSSIGWKSILEPQTQSPTGMMMGATVGKMGEVMFDVGVTPVTGGGVRMSVMSGVYVMIFL